MHSIRSTPPPLVKMASHNEQVLAKCTEISERLARIEERLRNYDLLETRIQGLEIQGAGMKERIGLFGGLAGLLAVIWHALKEF